LGLGEKLFVVEQLGTIASVPSFSSAVSSVRGRELRSPAVAFSLGGDVGRPSLDVC